MVQAVTSCTVSPGSACFSLTEVRAKPSSDKEKRRIVAGTRPAACHSVSRTRRPFLSSTGRGAVFLFGKTKRKIGGRRAPPLPGAEKGGLSAPQPRHWRSVANWRSVAKQDREWHSRQGGSIAQLAACKPAGRNGLPHQCAHWFAMTCKNTRRTNQWGASAGITLRPAYRLRCRCLSSLYSSRSMMPFLR